MDDITKILEKLTPEMCSYEEWLEIGMILKHEGFPVSEWDNWSSKDSRPKKYHPGECEKRWSGFNGSVNPVTMGTLVTIARKKGLAIEYHGGTKEIDWDATIGDKPFCDDDYKQMVDVPWLQDAVIKQPAADWDGREDLKKYLAAVFQPNEHVCYVVECFERDEKLLPTKGVWDRTAGQIIAALKDPVNCALGDWNQEAGGWIRFNPVDGVDVRDENVTSLRHALVESDTMTCEKQLAIYRELELPCAAIVHSGGKSVHAIVKIEADSMPEYRKRVDFLYNLLKKNGVQIDAQNRNPSRLSRMPGLTRKGHRQFLIDTHCGKKSWEEWREWIEDVNDDLPELESLADKWTEPPPLAEPIIDGVLRHGHKLLVAGPSKAGKSFLLLNLAVAVAEGSQWLGWKVRQGKVLYVNLELDKASCINRLKLIYDAMKIPPHNVDNIILWHLRGKSMPMDKLAPKLIRRAAKSKISMVIIDPIYKVITGDENAAHEMAKFCNQFDRVCFELGVATVYCHHHSKGSQGGKQAQFRASGSGVFQRDPDALIDMTELEIDEARRAQIVNVFERNALHEAFDKANPGWRDEIGQDDAQVANKLAKFAEGHGLGDLMREVRAPINASATTMSGWRIEGILREFPSFPKKQIFFRYPLHIDDKDNLLDGARADGEEPPRRSPKEAGKDKAQINIEKVAFAVEAARDERGLATIEAVAEKLGIMLQSAYKTVKKAGFKVARGFVEIDENKKPKFSPEQEKE